jgi:hypothetical protein
MPRCKAAEILRNKAYLEGTSLTKDEANAADGRLPGHSLGEGWFFISLLEVPGLRRRLLPVVVATVDVRDGRGGEFGVVRVVEAIDVDGVDLASEVRDISHPKE